MAIEVQRLIATLEARLDKYEKALGKANGLTNSSFKKIETRGKLMETRLAALGTGAFLGFAKGAAAGIAPILGVAAAIGTAKAALNEFSDIADNSRASGLDAEFFQGIAYGAQQGGIAFDEISGALQTFNKNAGLAAANKGKMYAALKVLNPELLKNIDLATSQEQRVRLAADAIVGETDASRKGALATVLFGDAGAKLADVFSDGAQGLDDWISKARQIGIIVDRDLIARADKLGDEFDTASKVLDLQFKEVLVELAPVLTATAQGIADIIRQLRSLGEVKDPFAGLSTSDLAKQAADLDKTLHGGKLAIDFWGGGEDRLAAMQKELANRAAAAKSQATLGAGPSTFDFNTFLNPKKVTSAFDPDADGRAQKALDQAEATKKYIEQLRFENSLIGTTELQQKELTAARESGAKAGSKEAETVKELVDKNYLEQQQVEALTQAYNELSDIGKSAIHDLIDAFDDGSLSGEEFLGIINNIVGKLEDMVIDAAFSGGANPLSTLFSSIFGGHRARGGPVEPGKVYDVGERGPEKFVPTVAGKILPSSGGSGPINVRVINSGPPIEADVQARQTPRGVDLEVMVDRIGGKKIATRGSQMNRALAAAGELTRR
jgi:hypothetical protein